MMQSPVVNQKSSVETNLLLEVKHVWVDYIAGGGVAHAVNDVSFTLNRGEIMGLAGESGCGKSTLAYAIIAIALALNPELIIMDEPTTALHVVVQREILTEIIRLREEFGFSVIFITHDLLLLLELADKVAIMSAGRMVEKAANRDLYRHPRHPCSYGLLLSFPSLHGPRTQAGGIPGLPPDLRAIPSGCPFHPRFLAGPQIQPVLQQAQGEASPLPQDHAQQER